VRKFSFATMRLLIIILYSAFSLTVNGQNDIVGKYHNYSGENIELKADSTFKYEWHFDMMASWNSGTWTTYKDTIYLTMVYVYDTLKYLNKSGQQLDSFILSVDDKPSQTNLAETALVYSGSQDGHPCPDKLFFSKARLFGLRDGKLYKRKVKSFWTSKKFDPWFVKLVD